MPEFKKFALQGIFTQHQRQLRQMDKDLLVLLEEILTNLGYLLNAGLNFSDNFDGEIWTYTSNGVANTEDAVPHTLGKVPTGYVVTSLDKGGVVYVSGTAWTSSNLYLKCSTATTVVKLLIF